jgi:hypothetical protein
MFTSDIICSADEGLKSCAFMVDNMMDPKTSSSQDPTVSPFARAFNTNDGVWQFYEQPGNEKRFRRFGAVTIFSNSITTPEAVLASAFSVSCDNRR